LILSEDDNEFSQNFLAFINNGLNAYEHNDKVTQSVLQYPVEMPASYSNDYYFIKTFSGWVMEYGAID